MAGKWIDDLSADTSLPDAARRVLTARLEAVRDALPPAAREPDQDPEPVHRLRVGTRRAGAALDIFSLCLPRKVRKAAKKHLRRLRRAASEARDWDVFLHTLAEWQKARNGRHRAGLDFLAGYATARRRAAQAGLEDAVVGHPFDFDRSLAETVAAVRKPHGRAAHTLGDLARPWLTDLLKELDAAAARDLDDHEQLHEVRIVGKRLRYAMEVFAPCFAAAFREELYPAVERMQEILGNANDSRVAVGRLEALRDHLRAASPADWERYRTGVEGLLKFHEQRLPQEREHFAEWWERWRESGGEAALTNRGLEPATE